MKKIVILDQKIEAIEFILLFQLTFAMPLEMISTIVAHQLTNVDLIKEIAIQTVTVEVT